MDRIDVNPEGAHLCHSPFSGPAERRTAVPGLVLVFDVEGTPTPQGSKNVFPGKRKDGTYTGKFSVTESAGERLKVWRAEIVAAAMVAKVKAGWGPANGPVVVDLVFYLPRPKGHYGSGRNAGVLKDSAPAVPTTKPDGDKLTRAALDALTTAAVYRDDSQVVDVRARKRFADGREPGVRVTVSLPVSRVAENVH